MRDEQAAAEARTWLNAGAPADDLPHSIFRAFVDALPESVVWLDRDLRIVYANASFLSDFGIGWDDAVGTAMIELVDPARRSDTQARLDRALALSPSNPTRTEEFAGESAWLSSVFSAFFTSDGELAVISDLARDHTAQRDATVELETMNQRLAESNRDLQDFAYIASHDLQEPLRKISAFGDRLATKYDDVLDERGLDYLARIRSASSRMQTLIDDVLTFSRVATHTQPASMTNVADIVHGVVDDLEVAIGESNATIELGDLPTLPVDPSQLRQLFQNLIGNALKFRAPDRPPHVRITASQIFRPSGSSAGQPVPGWSIEVQDNGIGFEEKYRDRIFTVFQRLHNRSAYAGSGVGLAVCRRIVERHRGSLDVTSEPDVGSTFTVWLPSEAPTA